MLHGADVRSVLAILACLQVPALAQQPKPAPTSPPLAAPEPTDAPRPTAAAVRYDPLALPGRELPPALELTARDAARERSVPLRICLPAGAGEAPVVLFSHGLGGTRDGSRYLGEHWAARGYAVVFLQHPGSDDSVWRGERPARRMAAMERAASGENFVLRCQDVSFVLDQLAIWNEDREHACAGRFDLEHVGMAGHSFGAVTTQAVAGQAAPLVGQRFVDDRIDAALPMSPSSPRRGDVGRAFAQVRVPWLLMTGTADTSPIGDQDVASRLAVFPALPKTIDRCELVLHEAEHSAFTDRALPGDRHGRNPNHHRAILAISTAFWDAHLRGDGAARAWLMGDGVRSVLDAEDRWQALAGERAQDR